MSTQPTDYSALRFWFDAGQYGLTLAIGAYVLLGSRFNAKTREVKGVHQEVSIIAERVTKLETNMAHALSHEDLAAVYDRINDVAEEVAGLSGKMDGVKGTVEMIQEYLLNDGCKR